MLLDTLDQPDTTDNSSDSNEEGESSCDSDGLSKNPLNNDVHGYRYLYVILANVFYYNLPVLINIVFIFMPQTLWVLGSGL